MTSYKYLTERIENLEDELEQAEQSIEEQQLLYKGAAAKFIETISMDDEEMVEHAVLSH